MCIATLAYLIDREVRYVVEVAAGSMQICTAPGDPGVSANRNEWQAWGHQTDRMVRRGFVAGNEPRTRQMDPEVGVVRHERGASGTSRP